MSALLRSQGAESAHKSLDTGTAIGARSECPELSHASARGCCGWSRRRGRKSCREYRSAPRPDTATRSPPAPSPATSVGLRSSPPGAAAVLPAPATHPDRSFPAPSKAVAPGRQTPPAPCTPLTALSDTAAGLRSSDSAPHSAPGNPPAAARFRPHPAAPAPLLRESPDAAATPSRSRPARCESL